MLETNDLTNDVIYKAYKKTPEKERAFLDYQAFLLMDFFAGHGVEFEYEDALELLAKVGAIMQ